MVEQKVQEERLLFEAELERQRLEQERILREKEEAKVEIRGNVEISSMAEGFLKNRK